MNAADITVVIVAWNQVEKTLDCLVTVAALALASLAWLGGVLTGDLGISLTNGSDIATAIGQRLAIGVQVEMKEARLTRRKEAALVPLWDVVVVPGLLIRHPLTWLVRCTDLPLAVAALRAVTVLRHAPGSCDGAWAGT